jgi:hypothetical protein
MRAIRRLLCSGVVAVALAGMTVSPVGAQTKVKVKVKDYAVTSDRAISVTRTVLVQRGYNVVRVERVGPTQVVYYRVKRNKHGRTVGPMQRLVIRTVRDRVVFEEAEPSVLIDIDVKLN